MRLATNPAIIKDMEPTHPALEILRPLAEHLRKVRSRQPALNLEQLRKQVSEGAETPEEIAKIRASVIRIEDLPK